LKTISITTVPGFDEWRAAARVALAENLHPSQLLWRMPDCPQSDLFTGGDQPIVRPPTASAIRQQVKVPPAFMSLCEAALCHRDSGRFEICYRILWRLLHENRELLNHKTDSDVIKATALAKAVRRDAYKISAFLRFRKTECRGQEHFVAWYEPEHYSLELKLDFFKTRFKNMCWSILTPYRAAHWNTEVLRLEDNPEPLIYPEQDEVESYWLSYYENTFNPARLKVKAMQSQMPKKYWHNLPEARLIKGLIRDAEPRARAMLDKAEGGD